MTSDDVAESSALAHLLKYDTVMGRFKGEVHVEGKTLLAGRHSAQMPAVADPAQLPWKASGRVDIVVGSTGHFTKRTALEPQLTAGAKILHERFRIVKGMMPTIHTYTNDQRLTDVPHNDPPRARQPSNVRIRVATSAPRKAYPKSQRP